ncbi:MAG TPA: lytic transglycosylase domain-containing protein [Thermoanaerobaculia bacterium]|nr:lytic transglycosylase domain-containing protein [Thermoanaerobaculia bacterium]HUM30837.1 lytic transglycosylase domain-containing protein [Thermoanaerobaculia bacterium]HXK69182.1 lytic transglycosylase domain-containing protein [Thermoanaerobaculia bacterium]
MTLCLLFITSAYLLVAGVEDWEAFDQAYRLVKEGHPEGWETLRAMQDQTGEIGEVVSWLLFQNAREQGDRLLALHYGRKILKTAAPGGIIEEVVDFELQCHHEVGSYREALSLYDTYRTRLSSSYQRKFRTREALYRYRINDHAYRRLLRTILRSGSDREKLDIFLLFKGYEKLFSTDDLIRILEGSVALQQWDVHDQVREIVTGRRLNSSQSRTVQYLDGRRAFRLDQFTEALKFFNTVAGNSSGSLREQALYQAARCHLFLRQNGEADRLLRSVRVSLSDVALYTRGRIAILEREESRLDQILPRIQSRKLKSSLLLLQSVARIREGDTTSSRKILLSLSPGLERDYWIWKSEPGGPPPNLGTSIFSYMVNEGRSVKPVSVTRICPKPESFEPHTFVEYLFSRDYFRLVLPYSDRLSSGWDLNARCQRAEIFMKAGLPNRAISLFWKESQEYSRRPPQTWPDDLRRFSYPRAYLDEVQRSAVRWRIPPNLLLAVIRQESLFQQSIHSPAGAWGLMQILPVTAKKLGGESVDLRDPKVNIEYGARYLARLYDTYGRWDHVVAAYNAGEAAVNLWVESLGPAGIDYFYTFVPYRETKSYLDKVFSGWLVYESVGKTDSTSVSGSAGVSR